MMKLYSYYLCLAVIITATTLTGCTADDTVDLSPRQGERVISLRSTVQTTRTTSDLQSAGANIANGIQIGAFGVVAGGATITNGVNNKYTADGSGGLSASQEMSSTDGSVIIYAYAPYQNSWSAYNTANGFSVRTDQSSDADYLASDLLYASTTTTTGSASLSFTHKLSRVCLTITNSTGADLSGVTVKVLGTKTSTTLRLSDGALGEASGETSDITLASNISIAAGGKQTVYGIVVPRQTVAAHTELFSIHYGEKTVYWKLGDAAVTFISNNSYKASIDIEPNTISGTISVATTPGL